MMVVGNTGTTGAIIDGLKNNVALVKFIKKDGSYREMVATRNLDLISYFSNVVGHILGKRQDVTSKLLDMDSEKKREAQIAGGYVHCFDLEKLSFRTFNVERLIDNPEVISDVPDMYRGEQSIKFVNATSLKWLHYVHGDSAMPKSILRNYLRVFQYIQVFKKKGFQLKGTTLESLLFENFSLVDLDTETATYLVEADENLFVNPYFIINSVTGDVYYSKIKGLVVTKKPEQAPVEVKDNILAFIEAAKGKHTQKQKVYFTKEELRQILRMEGLVKVDALAEGIKALGVAYANKQGTGEVFTIGAKSGFQMQVRPQTIDIKYLEVVLHYQRKAKEPLSKFLILSIAEFKNDPKVVKDIMLKETLIDLQKMLKQVYQGILVMDEFTEKQQEVLLSLYDADIRTGARNVVSSLDVGARTVNSLIKRDYLEDKTGEGYKLSKKGLKQAMLLKVNTVIESVK